MKGNDMWYIGQRVICINDVFTGVTFETTPVKGIIYTIRDIQYDNLGNGLFLEEIINSKQHYLNGYLEACFNARKFKPLDEKRIDIFCAMLKEKEKVE